MVFICSFALDQHAVIVLFISCNPSKWKHHMHFQIEHNKRLCDSLSHSEALWRYSPQHGMVIQMSSSELLWYLSNRFFMALLDNQKSFSGTSHRDTQGNRPWISLCEAHLKLFGCVKKLGTVALQSYYMDIFN